MLPGRRQLSEFERFRCFCIEGSNPENLPISTSSSSSSNDVSGLEDRAAKCSASRRDDFRRCQSFCGNSEVAKFNEKKTLWAER